MPLENRLRDPMFGWFFLDCAVQRDRLILKTELPLFCCHLHTALPKSFRAMIPGFGGSQAGTGGSEQQSTSPTVHLRLVLPAAIAGVRRRFPSLEFHVLGK
jgi:hypothetical protein